MSFRCDNCHFTDHHFCRKWNGLSEKPYLFKFLRNKSLASVIYIALPSVLDSTVLYIEAKTGLPFQVCLVRSLPLHNLQWVFPCNDSASYLFPHLCLKIKSSAQKSMKGPKLLRQLNKSANNNSLTEEKCRRK